MNNLRIIQEQVCKFHGFKMEQMLSKDRHQTIKDARNMAYWLCRKLTEHSVSEIGRAFKRCHGSVLSGMKSCEQLYRISQRMARRREILTCLCINALEEEPKLPENTASHPGAGKHSLTPAPGPTTNNQ